MRNKRISTIWPNLNPYTVDGFIQVGRSPVSFFSQCKGQRDIYPLMATMAPVDPTAYIFLQQHCFH